MKQINSILLECELTADPVITDSEMFPRPSCHFAVENIGTDSKSGLKCLEKSSFTVETWGKLSELSRRELKKGRAIRVVGRIKSRQGDDHIDLPEFFIVAEHIEIKPEKQEQTA